MLSRNWRILKTFRGNPARVFCTHVGLDKECNEDCYLIKEVGGGLLLAVADGVGGNPGGDLAAQLAIDSIDISVLQEEGMITIPQQLAAAMLQANALLLRTANEHPEVEGMGATLTVAWLANNQAYWGHVGDSRLYRLHDGVLFQATTDQNLAQELYASGEISVQELSGHRMRGFLSQCLGEDGVVPACGQFTVAPGDLLLLSTDGLHDWLSDLDITGILSLKTELQERAEQLIASAVKAGSADDITVVLADV